MKKAIFAAAFLFFSLGAKAQLDFTINPVALLFEAVVVSLEYNVSPDWSIGADALAASGGYAAYGTGRYFFNPKYGCDKFSFGAFAGGFGAQNEEGDAGLGFMFGYKAVSQKKVVFQVDLGGGRGFKDGNFLPYARLNIGYRFGLLTRNQ
jgi:hypothetical protein